MAAGKWTAHNLCLGSLTAAHLGLREILSPMVGGLVPSSPTVYSRPTPQRVRRGASEGWPGAREAAPNRGAGLTAVLLSSAQIPFRTAFPTVTEVHPLGSGRGSEEMRCRKVAARARPVPSRPVPSRPVPGEVPLSLQQVSDSSRKDTSRREGCGQHPAGPSAT